MADERTSALMTDTFIANVNSDEQVETVQSCYRISIDAKVFAVYVRFYGQCWRELFRP